MNEPHKQDHPFHIQHKLKYTRKNIYTQIQENVGTGANGDFL